MNITVNEVFGPTLQGEGPRSGRRCAFVRLARCNLNCSWCDTPYTWDWKGQNGVAYDPSVEARTAAVRDVVAAVGSFDVAEVVISGGEPLVQRHGMQALVEALVMFGYHVSVETNGTLPPGDLSALVDLFTVSPKLAHSGCAPEARYRPEALDAFSALARADAACFKFVVAAEADVDEVAMLVGAHRLPDRSVWLMPEGRTAAEVLSRQGFVNDTAVAHGWNACTRLHVLGWGDERGR